MIRVENLVKKFPAGKEALAAVDGIDIEAPAGEIVTLLGPSGCGKTTTLRCIAGLERATAGRIVIDERTVASTSIPSTAASASFPAANFLTRPSTRIMAQA